MTFLIFVQEILISTDGMGKNVHVAVTGESVLLPRNNQSKRFPTLVDIQFFIVLIVGVSIVAIFWYWRPLPTGDKATNEQQECFIETYAFPTFIEKKIKQKYSHLTDDQIAQVLTGLRDFFHACQKAGKIMVGMPSQIVDLAWHEFILDTREYQYFCERAFDRFLHHTPAEAMPAETDAQQVLKRAWMLTCSRENIDPKVPTRLPLLFRLDSELQIADGFFYSLDECKGEGAPYCAKRIGCTWVPTRKDPPQRWKIATSPSRRGCGGGCGSSCGGGCGGD